MAPNILPPLRKLHLPYIEVDMKRHPTQFFINKSREHRDGHAIVSMSTINGHDKRKSGTYTAELKNHEALTNKINCKIMEQIGHTLHPFLQQLNTNKGSQSHLTYANPNLISINQLEANKDSLLRNVSTVLHLESQSKRHQIYIYILEQ